MNTNPLMDLIPSDHQNPFGDIASSLKSWRAAWEELTEKVDELEARIEEIDVDGAEIKATEALAHDTCCELTHERDHGLSTLDQLRAITERQAELYPSGHITCRIIDRRFHLRLWRNITTNTPVSGDTLPEAADAAAKLLGLRKWHVHHHGTISIVWALIQLAGYEAYVRQLRAKGWDAADDRIEMVEVQP